MKNEVEKYLYEYFYNNLDINKFEQWVYQSNEIEKFLDNDDYLALISLDYSDKYIEYEIRKILESYIDYAKFETWKLLSLLNDALDKTKNTAKILMVFYNLYCQGYDFLETLGLGYGLSCEVPPSNYSAEFWGELTDSEKAEIIAGFYPGLIDDINEVINWLKREHIILTGEKNKAGHWTFLDNRTEDEKKAKYKEIRKRINDKNN